MPEEKFTGFDPELKSWDFPMIINGWVHKLTGSEFKVLWYILRHTYGWQKDSDAISYRQFQYGIKKKNGEWIDRGTGLGLTAIKSAIKGLVEKGFIERDQTKDKKGRWTITRYKPRYTFPPTDLRTAEKYTTTIFNNKQSLINNNNNTLSYDNGNHKFQSFLEEKEKLIKKIGGKINHVWQDEALRYAKNLGIDFNSPEAKSNKLRERWFRFFKDAYEQGKQTRLYSAYSYLADYPEKLNSLEKAKLFFWRFANG